MATNDFRMAIPLAECPAVGCDDSSQPSLQRVSPTTHGPLHARLAGEQPDRYDYYWCHTGCRRLWRIERRDMQLGEAYREPEWIGKWNDDRASEPTIFDRPRASTIRWRYRRSKTDPLSPARNKTDAR